MDRISSCSQVVEGVGFSDLWIPSLLFAEDVILLASSNSDLQLSLGRFAAECEAAGWCEHDFNLYVSHPGNVIHFC